MANSTAVINPIDFPAEWHVYHINGVVMPGVIAVDGVHGFKRSTGWDVKKGKGVKGGTLTLLQRPPAKGSIKTLLWLPEHFSAWNAFREELNYDPDKEPTQALAISYPALEELKINGVVVADISPTTHHGKGLYSVTVDYIEFLPPPKTSIVDTPTTASTTSDDEAPGALPDLAIVTEQVLMSSNLALASAP